MSSTQTGSWEAVMQAEDPPPHSAATHLVAAAVEPLAERWCKRVAELVVASVQESRSPWMTKTEAIEYTRIARGTFEKMAADGRIPSHGGKTKVFHRDELDSALGFGGAR